MTYSNKTIIATSTPHPFGETDVEEGSEHYLYTGKEKDFTRLYYYGARYYDPETGGFMTGDLIKRRNQILKHKNVNIYSLNDPFNCYDLID